jgi:predicted amidohydrolase YtcJ
MAHARGVTACGSYDADGPDFENIVAVYRDIYEEAQKAGIPALRITMQCGISAREDILDEYLKMRKNFTTEYTEEEAPPSLRAPPCPSVVNYSCHPIWGSFLKMGPIKLFGDGTLGTHTAWMRHPYRDKPETRGVPVLDDQTITHLVQKASAGGMQVLVHSIGDAGIDSVLSAFETVTAPGNNPLRHGIIHCQITAADLLERMARNKILALVQPVFLADDRHILERRVGQELAATSYAWGSMRRLGIPVSYSTDAPVSGIDPLQCISWAVLRRDSDNPDSTVFNPGERVDVYSAVDAYTAGSAFSAFDEKERGRIAPGYLADLVFLDRDIFTIPPEDIGKTRVLRTICAGETVFRGSY